MNFFWQKNAKAKNTRSRFNLLLLEHGEYYFEDYSVYLISPVTGDRVQGRLKVCSRSLVFEPIDFKRPLIKFPYRKITADIDRWNYEFIAGSPSHIDFSGMISFMCTCYFEMKANDKVGPYRQVNGRSAFLAPELSKHDMEDGSTQIQVVLGFVHSELMTVIGKLQHLKNVTDLIKREGKAAEHLLTPMVEMLSLTEFDTSRLVDFHEKLLISSPLLVQRVKPLVLNPGCLMVTDLRIYFQPAQLNNIGEAVHHFDIRKITKVYKRRHLLRQTGLELMMNDNTSALFVLDSRKARDDTYDLISAQMGGKRAETIEELTQRWQRREISNFQYIMQLNVEADRSVNDLTQYPVFPQIIADYTSRRLDLTNDSVYRDLSRPMGALNPSRLDYFKERFRTMPPADPALGLPPPFLYGTHYSTPGYVLFYLVRVAPEHMLCLQDGKFDSADRMFSSLSEAWSSSLNNPADLKELIPEFFSGNGEFLMNTDDFYMGHRSSGERLGDVELPKWARSSRDFIRQNAKALESDYVSNNLHKWIDLIFGYKQKGEEAIAADNLYYHLTYEGSVDLENITDVRERQALELQIQEFGQTPKQLFFEPHPSRNDSGYAPTRRSESPKAAQKSPDARKPTHENVGADAPGVHDPAGALNRKSTSSVSTPVRGQSIPSQVAGNKPNGEIAGIGGMSSPTSPDSSSKKLSAATEELEQLGITPAKGEKVRVLGNDFREEVQDLTRKLSGEPARYQSEVSVSTAANSRTTSTVDGSRSASTASAVGDNANADGKNLARKSSFLSMGAALGSKAASFLDRTLGTSVTSMLTPNKSMPENHSEKEESLKTPENPSNDSKSGSIGGNQNMQEDLSANQELPKPPSRSSTLSQSTPLNALSASADSLEFFRSREQSLPEKIRAQSSTDNQIRDLWADLDICGGMGTGRPVDLRTLALTASDPIPVHVDAVSGLSIAFNSKSGQAREETVGDGIAAISGTVCSCSRDSFLKVLHVDVSGTDPSNPATSSSAQFRSTVKRTFSASNSALSACKISPDGERVLVSSWDNAVYSYSVSHACALGKKVVHEDGVSTLSMDTTDRLIVTGSWDTAVKVFEVKADKGTLGNSVVAEFYDLESSVQAVDVNGSGAFIAAGAEDGTLIIWNAHTQHIQVSTQIGNSSSPISSLCWMPMPFLLAVDPQKPHRNEKLVCVSMDGTMVIMDYSGRLCGAVKVDVPIRSVVAGVAVASPQPLGMHQNPAGSKHVIFGGCEDGSLRVWACDDAGTGLSGAFTGPTSIYEVFRFPDAHMGAVTSLALRNQLLVSGGEDGTLRLWRLAVQT